MLKVIVLGSTVLFGMVYWGVGLLLNATMSMWLFMYPPVQNPSYVPQNASDVQLSGGVTQAQPSNLQVGENIQ